MAKMVENDGDVLEFINNIEKEKKRLDSLKILEIFEEASGYPAKMWGDRIIGFGKYHYEYETGHSGDAPLVGFAPGKGHHISLYLKIPYSEVTDEHLNRLGKHKTGQSCVYINKLADIDTDVLSEMVTFVTKYMEDKFPNK